MADGLRIRPDSDLEDTPFDEMDFLHSPQHELKRSSKYTFTSDKGTGSSTRALIMPQEGEAYMKLEAKYPELSDPIEQFPDSIGSGVRQLVKKYEDNSGSEPRPPKVDFRKRNLKSGMKKSSKVWESLHQIFHE